MLMTWTEFKTKYRLCDEAVDYIDALGLVDCNDIIRHLVDNPREECNDIVRKLANNAKERWAIWILSRLLDLKNSRILSIFCAELVLPIFETKYPDDNRPRKAIEAARSAVILRAAAYAAYAAAADAAAADAMDAYAAAADAYAMDAYAAADAAYAYAAAADAAIAAYAADAAIAAYAAAYAANAAHYADYAADYAAAYAYDAVYAALVAAGTGNNAISKVILDEGLRLLEEQSKC